MKLYFSGIKSKCAHLLLFSIVTFFCGDLYGQGIPELMYFKFTNTTNTNEADVSTRVSTTGTLNGATIGGTGQFGTAMLGTGGATASNSLNANWALNLSGAWTISMWFSGVTNLLSNNYMFGGSGGTTFRALTGSGVVAGAGNLEIRSTGMTDVFLYNVFDAIGTPVVCTYVYDPTIPAIKGYVNGALVTTITQPNNLTLTGTDFTIGGQAASTGLNSGGKMDEFRLYNRALSAAEIAATWNVELNACAPITGLAATNITVSSAAINWSPVTGSAGYEYVIDQTAANPSGPGTPISATGFPATGLNTNTTYYVHVRNKCSATVFGGWATITFTTPTAYCIAPINLLFSGITNTSADVLWTLMPTATSYQYKYDITKNIVLNGNNSISTPNITAHLPNLLPGTKYYVFVRSICLNGGDSSVWKLDSFITKNACETPVLTIADPGTNNPTASWLPVPSAVEYEYVITESTDKPAFGTSIATTSVTLNLPVDGKNKYLYVRAKCNSQFLFSEWAMEPLRLVSQGITNINTDRMLDVYPNPATTQVTIDAKKLNGDASAILMDGAGRIIRSIHLDTEKTVINLEGVSPGMYILRFSDAEHTEFVRITKR